MHKCTITIKRIDINDKKLMTFLLLTRERLKTSYDVLRAGTLFHLQLGITESSPNFYPYVEIEFDGYLAVDLEIFEKEIPLLLDTEQLKIETADRVKLRRQQDNERKNIETNLRNQFPLALEAFNTYRRACRIALFKESVALRLLDATIRASQEHYGIESTNSTDDLIIGNDTEFLFATFADISLTSFSGDADIDYSVKDEKGRIICGTFKNGYHHIHSIHSFSEKQNEIQNLVDNGWSIEDDVLLMSLEFLYTDNYRMAVFNAATLLEFTIVKFWEEKCKQLETGPRQDQEKLTCLERGMKNSRIYKTKVEKLLRIVIPEFINPVYISNGTLDRCITAWNIRNEKLAHPYVQVKKGESGITGQEAWDAVASIYSFLSGIKNC